MKNASLQNATLLSLAMAIVAGGFNIIVDHTLLGVGLVIFGGALPFGREYLKDLRKQEDREKRKRIRRRIV